MNSVLIAILAVLDAPLNEIGFERESADSGNLFAGVRYRKGRVTFDVSVDIRDQCIMTRFFGRGVPANLAEVLKRKAEPLNLGYDEFAVHSPDRTTQWLTKRLPIIKDTLVIYDQYQSEWPIGASDEAAPCAGE